MWADVAGIALHIYVVIAIMALIVFLPMMISDARQTPNLKFLLGLTTVELLLVAAWPIVIPIGIYALRRNDTL